MIPKHLKANFTTLQKAMRNGDVCLMEVQDKATKEVRYALCAVNRLPDGSFEMAPLATMIDGNPYELFNPPGDQPGTFIEENAA